MSAPLDRKKESESFVYFMRSGDFVKIGPAKNVKARLSEHRTSNPIAEIVATLDGGRTLERQLHQTFKNFRHDREFFRFEGTLKEYVEGIQSNDLALVA